MGMATVKRITEKFGPVMYTTPFREQDSDDVIIERMKDKIRHDHHLPDNYHLSGEFTVIEKED